MAQKHGKINKQHNVIGSRPKLEPRHKRAQGPTKSKTKSNPDKMGRLHNKKRIWKMNVKFDDGFLESYGSNSPKILRCNKSIKCYQKYSKCLM